MLEAAEKNQDTKDKDSRKPESNELLKPADKELAKTLRTIEEQSRSDKSATPGPAMQFQKAINALALSVEANDLPGRQQALMDLVKLEGTAKPAANKALEAFGAKTEDGVGQLRQRQVDFARAGATGGDDAVMTLARKSLNQLLDKQTPDDPKKRAEAMLDLGVAAFTLKTNKFSNTLMLAQTLDLAKELKLSVNTVPLDRENVGKTLDIMFAIQKSNPFAKQFLQNLRITDEASLQRYKEFLKYEGIQKGLDNSLINPTKVVENGLTDALKKQDDAKRAEAQAAESAKAAQAKAKSEKPEAMLTSVDMALCDVALPNGARDLAKRLAADKDGSLAKRLFGEGGTPELLKPFVQTSNLNRPFNEVLGKAKFAQALIGRKDALEKVVDEKLRPNIPYLDDAVKGLKEHISSVEKAEQAKRPAATVPAPGAGGDAPAPKANPAEKPVIKPGEKPAETAKEKPLSLKPSDKVLAREQLKPEAALNAVDWAICDVSKPTGGRDLAKRLAADSEGNSTKQLFGDKGLPANLKPWLEIANSAGPFNEELAKSRFAEALIDRKIELENVIPQASRPNIPYLEDTVQGLKDYIVAVGKLENAKRDVEKYPLPPGAPGAPVAPAKPGEAATPKSDASGGEVPDEKKKPLQEPVRFAPPADATRAKDTTDSTAPLTERDSLNALPRAELTQAALIRLLPAVDQHIKDQNKAAKTADAKAVDKPEINQSKLREEWKKNEFGPESRRLWAESQSYLQHDVIVLTAKLKARGLALPVGSPFTTTPSESGSGLPETDEMYGTRVRNGAKLDLGFKALKPGEVPSIDEVNKFINSFSFAVEAGNKYAQACIEGESTYIEQRMKNLEPIASNGNLDGWKRPADITTDRLERWNYAAHSYIDTALKVKNYAETIGAFHAATNTRGTDWPQLQDLFRLKNGVNSAMTIFPDEGLKDGVFPGKIERNPDNSVKSVQIDLPKTLDRTNPEDVAKMKKLEDWLEKYGKQVDQASNEIMLLQTDSSRVLVTREDDEIDQHHTVKASQVKEFREKNPTLKGVEGEDKGKVVSLSSGEDNFRIKKINADGSYELERKTPGKFDKDGNALAAEKPADYNLRRLGVEVSGACNKEGKPDSKGDYIKVTGYKDYYHKNITAYNNWDIIPGSVKKLERETTLQNVYHKNDFLVVVDNGRPRLMQAKNLPAWQAAYENGKLTGELVNLGVDLGMAASGTLEFRAGYVAAQQGGKTVIRAGLAGLKEGAWHLALAGTGFGKTAIEALPGGHTFMTIRHGLIMADMTASLAPGSKAAALGKLGKVFGIAERAPGEISVVEKFVQQPFSASALLQKPLAPGAALDQSILLTHKVMDGVEFGKYLPKVGGYAPGKYLVPKLGVMPLADYYMIAQFSDTVARVRQQGSPQDLLSQAVGKHRKPSDGQPFYGPQEIATAEQLKKATELVTSNWSAKLGDAQKEHGPGADQIEKAVKEAALLPRDNADRKQCFEKLLETYAGINEKSTRGEKLAAARGLLELTKGVDAKLPTLGFVKNHAVQDEQTEIKTADVIKFAANTGDMAQELLKKTVEFNSLPAGDPKVIETTKLATSIFQNNSATDHDRLAATILLMSSSSNSLDQPVAGSDTVKVSDLVKFLRDRANNSDSLNVKMVAGEMLLRTFRIGEATTNSQEAELAKLEGQLAKTPNDAAIQAKVGEAKELVTRSQEFTKAVNYNNADYASLCMEIVKSPNASTAQKLQAIASPIGPSLTLIRDQLKNQVEPDLLASKAPEVKMVTMGGLYGRDSFAIDKCLREIAADTKQNADVRALASQALNNGRLERQTVEQVPLTPGINYKVGTNAPILVAGTGVATQHATIRVGLDGKQEIKDLATSPAGTVIVRNGIEVKVGSQWTEVKPGDRVFLGSKEKGTELLLSHERFDSLATMNAKVTENMAEPGTISEEYFKGLRKTLEAPLLKPSGKEIEEHEQLVDKFRAALAALDCGASAFGLDETKHKQMIAAAFAQCMQRSSPFVAAAALQQLTPDLMKMLSPMQADFLREQLLTNVIIEPVKDKQTTAMRLATLEALPTIFADATAMQKRRAAGMAESMIVAGAADLNKAQEASDRDRGIYLYPRPIKGNPPIREAALRSLAELDLQRAVGASKLLLLGGNCNGQEVKPDVAAIRRAALDVLEKARPEEFHATAMQALRNETDPAVAAKLWNVEYGARRPEADRGRLQMEYDALNEKIGGRARPALAKDAETAWNNTLPGRHEVDRISSLWPIGQSSAVSPESKQARLAMIHLASTGHTVAADSGANYLQFACSRYGSKLAAELSGPLEYALLANPKADAEIKSKLVSAYMALTPGDNGIVSKAEAAVVLTKVLENAQGELANIKDKTSIDYRRSLALHNQILSYLKGLPAENVVPKLVALSTTHPEPLVRAEALRVANMNRDTTPVGRQLAEAELRAIETKNAADPAFQDKFGSRSKVATIADAMAEPLSKSNMDSKSVVKALHLGMISKPIEGPNDPRLQVLRIAVQDKSDTVRTEAAIELSFSPNPKDREQAIFIVADIAKNSASDGSKMEANWLLEAVRRNNPQLVNRALAETPSAQRKEPGREDATFTANPKAQRSFEDFRRRVLDGHQEAITWDWKNWQQFCTEAQLPLLTYEGVNKAKAAAASAVDSNRGTLTSFISRESTKEAERQAAKDLIPQGIPGQLRGLVEKAMNTEDLSPQGKAARQALAYIVMSAGDGIEPEYRAEAVKQAVEGIAKICTGSGAGRGEMEWVLRSLLANKPDLKPEYRQTLFGGLDSLTGDKGTISKENGAGIAMLALEQEVRFGRADNAQSLQYQTALLEFMDKNGNQDLGPALETLFRNYPDKAVQEKAAAVLATIKQRSSTATETVVSQMVADLDQNRVFTSIGDSADTRIQGLKSFMVNTTKNAEQRLRAAEILLYPGSTGVGDADRKMASAAYASIGLSLEHNDLKRYQTADRILDGTTQMFSDIDRKNAVAAMKALCSSPDPKIRQRAMLTLAKLPVPAK